MKGDIHRYVLSTSSFLWDVREPRYRQNATGYRFIKIVKNIIITYSKNLIPCTVLSVSRLANIAKKNVCTQMRGDIHRYVLSTISPLCEIGELGYRQNITRFPILRIVYYSIFDYIHNLIPCIVLPISRLPDIAQGTACTKNVPRNPTFHLSASSLLCNIGGPSYRQNNTGHHISRIGY